MVDFSKVIAQAKAQGEDMTKAQAFGEGTPISDMIPEGIHRGRFVTYVEIGKQKATYKGAPKIENQVIFGFEITGPRIKPREDGQPHIIELQPMNKSQSEKAKFFKLFNRLNHAGKATHVAELLGEAYRIEVFHRKGKGRDGKERIYLDLNKKGEVHAIYPTSVRDEETGEIKTVTVDPQKAPTRMFLWDFADMDQWNSIFIDGQWDEKKDEKTGEVTQPARSKNVLQNRIKIAENFPGSPIEVLLKAGGQAIDIPDAETVTGGDDAGGSDEQPETSKAPVQPVKSEADALSDIVG